MVTQLLVDKSSVCSSQIRKVRIHFDFMASSLSFARFVWKNLKHRRLRTLLTLCGIGMAIGAFVGLVGFSRSFEKGWLSIYSSSSINIAIIQQTFLNTSVDDSVGAKLKALPMAAQATPMIYNVMDLTPEVNALVYGWKAGSFAFQSLKLLDGQPFWDGYVEAMLGDLRVLALLPETASIVSSSVPWELSAEALGIAVMAGLAAGALPAWRGARLSPVETLWHD
jgi:ABC-type antimicrobial peptide transport system permease subunit